MTFFNQTPFLFRLVTGSEKKLALCFSAVMFSLAIQAPATAAEYLPNIERREIVTPGINNENFEISAFLSMVSVQDFSVEPHFGLRLSFHAHEDLFIEGSIGQADIGSSAVDRFSGSTPGVPETPTLVDRRWTDYHLSLGWHILAGQSSFLSGRQLIHNTYIIGGGGLTNFADQNNFTINGGLGHRVLINDSLAVRVEARDYIVSYDTPIPGSNSRTHNLALSLGLSMFF